MTRNRLRDLAHAHDAKARNAVDDKTRTAHAVKAGDYESVALIADGDIREACERMVAGVVDSDATRILVAVRRLYPLSGLDDQADMTLAIVAEAAAKRLKVYASALREIATKGPGRERAARIAARALYNGVGPEDA